MLQSAIRLEEFYLCLSGRKASGFWATEILTGMRQIDRSKQSASPALCAPCYGVAMTTLGQRGTDPHVLTIRVYWEDTDASGLVYHTSYIRFMERGRTELLRGLGLGQRALLAGEAGKPLFFVVRAMEIDFRRPATLDDLLVVETRVAEIGGASVSIDQQVTRDGELLIGARVKVVCVEGGRARRLRPHLRGKFEKALSS
jgi:acyl-CoA thioester hydrolase